MMLSDVWSQAWGHHLWLPLHQRHYQQPAGGGTQQVRLIQMTFLHYMLLWINHRTVLGTGGWVGFFLVLATFGLLAFLITCFFPGKMIRTYLTNPIHVLRYSYSYAFPASPEPGPRPLKTEAEVEDGKEAFTNNNIFKTEEKVQEDEENEREVEDASEDYMDEQQTCLDKS